MPFCGSIDSSNNPSFEICALERIRTSESGRMGEAAVSRMA